MGYFACRNGIFELIDLIYVSQSSPRTQGLAFQSLEISIFSVRGYIAHQLRVCVALSAISAYTYMCVHSFWVLLYNCASNKVLKIARGVVTSFCVRLTPHTAVDRLYLLATDLQVFQYSYCVYTWGFHNDKMVLSFSLNQGLQNEVQWLHDFDDVATPGNLECAKR